MDLHTVETVLRPRRRADLPPPRDGDALLAGGTWLFSEPQPGARRLIDLMDLGWPPHAADAGGLTLAATCTFAHLERLEPPADWGAAPLLGACCRALSGSFKVRAQATVGGNLCLALPAAPMAALAVALEGVCTVWSPGGGGRELTALDLVLGPRHTALAPGEVLRAVFLPAHALRRRAALRRASLSPEGRSAALLVGTLGADGAFALTVTASVRRPARLAFPGAPTPGALAAALDAAVPGAEGPGAGGPGAGWHDDVHGRPDWRRHVTHHLAREILGELAGEGATEAAAEGEAKAAEGATAERAAEGAS